MSLYAKQHYNCPTCRCTEPLVDTPAPAPTPLAAALAVPEVQALVLALNQYQLAAAGYVSVQSARDRADAALAALKGVNDGSP